MWTSGAGHGQHPAQRRQSLVLRWPDTRQPGRRLHQHRALPSHPPRRDIRQHRYVGIVDEVERSFAFQALRDYPFYVVIGRAVSEQFAPWRQTGPWPPSSPSPPWACCWRCRPRCTAAAGNSREPTRLRRPHRQPPGGDLRVAARHHAAHLQRALRRAARRPAASLPGTRWIDSVPEAKRAEVNATIARMLQGAGTLTTDRRLRQADGARAGCAGWIFRSSTRTGAASRCARSARTSPRTRTPSCACASSRSRSSRAPTRS